MKPELKKLLVLNLPYLLFVYLFAKCGQTYRLSAGADASAKLLHLTSGISAAFASPLLSRTMTTDMFISLVRKYTRAKKLTPRMLNELVEKIEVFNAEKVNGVWEQRLRIHYNCVGTIEIPSALPLPTPDVSVNTRKGVVVNYAPCDVAI